MIVLHSINSSNSRLQKKENNLFALVYIFILVSLYRSVVLFTCTSDSLFVYDDFCVQY